jgi:hypothetical protein
MTSLRWFFFLYSQNRTLDNKAQGATDEQIAAWRQFVVWLGCAIGIIVAPYATAASAGNYTEFTTMFGSLPACFGARCSAWLLPHFCSR